jgi:hypothetical protein
VTYSFSSKKQNLPETIWIHESGKCPIHVSFVHSFSFVNRTNRNHPIERICGNQHQFRKVFILRLVLEVIWLIAMEGSMLPLYLCHQSQMCWIKSSGNSNNLPLPLVENLLQINNIVLFPKKYEKLGTSIHKSRDPCWTFKYLKARLTDCMQSAVSAGNVGKTNDWEYATMKLICKSVFKSSIFY